MNFHFYLDGRLVYVKTGPSTQTVNVCDARNKRGQDNCDWRVRVARNTLSWKPIFPCIPAWRIWLIGSLKIAAARSKNDHWTRKKKL